MRSFLHITIAYYIVIFGKFYKNLLDPTQPSKSTARFVLTIQVAILNYSNLKIMVKKRLRLRGLPHEYF